MRGNGQKMKSNRSALFLVIVCLTLAWCIPSTGQVLKGSIAGTVVDPQGAVVPGAQVKTTNIATGASLSTVSDNSGTFRFNLIPPGTYRVEISAQHFKTAFQNDIIVAAGRESGLGNVVLPVGETTTTVEVTAAAPLIDPTQSQVTNTFSGLALQSIAGVQENQGLDGLALFVPGVTSVRDSAFTNANGGVGFSSNGLRGRSNDQQIDGQNNNDNSVGGPSLALSDAEFVAQYVLINNQFGPEYGRNSGSVVNIVTKSGANSWRGSIYGAENNSILNSLNNLQKNPLLSKPTLTKPPRSNDEFGGFTIGGPWIKSKLFFFGGFDQEIISQSTIYSSTNLTPTPAGLATLAGCPGVNANALTALSKFGPYGSSGGNPVPAGTPVTDVVSSCPTAEFAGITRTLATPSHQFNWIARSDLQLKNDVIAGRYIFNRVNFFNTEDNGAAGYTVNIPALNQSALISWTRNFSPKMVNEVRIGFTRLNAEFGGNSLGTEPVAGNLGQALANIVFSASGLLGFGPSNVLPQGRIVNTWQAVDNWNYAMGRHTLKAGANFTYQRSPNIFFPNFNGAYRFTDWNAYFANTPNRVRVANGPTGLDFREYDTFAYFGDDWKLTQHLILNLGLTWSYYGQPANLFNDITTARENNPSTAFWASTDAFGNPIPFSERTEPVIPAPKNSWGPSVGFAYTPQWGGFLTGNGKTVIRGGYRLLYDPPFYNIYLNIATSAPEVFLQSFTGASAASKPLPADPHGPNVRAALAPFLTPGVLDPRSLTQTRVAPDFGPDRIHTWNFGVERELTKSSAFETRYVGNRGVNLFQTVNENPLISQLSADYPALTAGLTPCSAANAIVPAAVGRINCNQGVLRERTNTGYSSYNAAQLQYRATNLFKQLTVQTGYTFSKTLDNVSEIFSTNAAGNTGASAQNPLDVKKGEYSFSGLDFPHQWTLTLTEQVPFFKDQHGLAGHLLGGWSVSANYILASGQRYTPVQISTATFSNPGTSFSANSPGDYYDLAFWGAFFGNESSRPFIGNLKAPATSVGIYAGDFCQAIASSPSDPTCSLAPSTLLKLNSLNGAVETIVPITKDNVRFIVNGFVAQGVFGTPFGNAARNIVTDAMTNVANLGVYKQVKLAEHSAFEFHVTFLNAFNHSNFQTVDPFVEDAGLNGFSSGPVGFGNVSNSNTGLAVSNSSPTRRIIFGGKLTF
jgi:Carboxypeptidase regulatory-like domain